MELANEDLDMLQILAECRNTTHSKQNPQNEEGLDCARPNTEL